jgi:NAD(P)-dependent dehydrogenase (short-subunit alcohol dehydrogenase family)
MATGCSLDISSLDGAREAVQAAVAEFGRLDGMVCCAGNLLHSTVQETTEDEWDDILRVHLRGHYACTRAAAEVMIGQGVGRVIHFSSAAAVFGPPFQAAYSSAKAGILGLTVSSAQSLAPHGITVNCVMPGGATRMTDMIWADPQAVGDRRPSADLTMTSAEAKGTWRDPANVAPFVVYLLSDRAGDINAQAFGVVGYQVTQVRHFSFGQTIRSDRPWTLDELAERVAELEAPAPPWRLPWPPD